MGTLPTTTTLPASNALVQIAFPPNGATSDTHIVVRGSANASVTQVSVNGVAATMSGSTWRVDVPLNVGTNALSVSVVSGGATKTAVASTTIERFASDSAVTRGTGQWAGRILGMAYDVQNQRVIMSDDIVDGAWQMDMATGNRKNISNSESSPKTGGGIDLTSPTAVTTSANQCFVVDQQLIAAIDLTNGNRTLLIDTKTGGFGDLYLTPDLTSMIVLDLNNEAIIRMSPINGSSTVISSATVGSGTSTHNIAGLGVSFKRNKAYYATYYTDPIIAVDLTTGVRSNFSTAASGEPKFSDPRHVIVDDITDQAFAYDSKSLTAISLATGRRTSIGNTGTLSTLTSIVTMTMTPYGPLLLDYVGNGEGSGAARSPTLILVDPIEGTRLILSR